MTHPDQITASRPAPIVAGATRSPLRIAAAMAAVMSLTPTFSHAVPVIPNATGFGISTPAGRGGVVHRVTNLNTSGAGSLKACIDATGPRVCVFEVSGTIRMTDDLHVRNPYITIAGQTAPSPGVMLRGGALLINTSEVLVQHLRVRAGDDPVGPAPHNRDALKIESISGRPIQNIVVDHCSFSWATDEVVSAWKEWNNVTLSNNIISEGLHESSNPLGSAGYGLLMGPWTGRVSITGNLLAHNYGRNPLSRASQMLFVNNVVYGGQVDNLDLQSEGLSTSNTIIGNVFLKSPDSNGTKAIRIRDTGNWPVPGTSKVHVSDNYAPGMTADPWSVVAATSGSVPASMKSKLPPIWPSGMTRLPVSNNTTYDNVLRAVGARPADRDSVDKRIIQQVRDRTGGIINCVSSNGTTRCNKNAGGWPTLATNHRPLTLPSNPNQVTESGYTNLELWLHDMSAQAEGRNASPPRAPQLIK